MDRKKFLYALGILPAAVSLKPFSGTIEKLSNINNRRNTMGKFELPSLPYSYDALEPYIDKQTMEIHHTKHHNAYVSNLNNAIAGTDLEGKSLEDLMKNISKHPAAVRN